MSDRWYCINVGNKHIMTEQGIHSLTEVVFWVPDQLQYGLLVWVQTLGQVQML